MSSFGSVVSKQQDLFQRIARAHENAKKLGKDRLSRHALEIRIKSLDSNWERFQEDHGKLVAARTEELQGHQYFAGDLFSDCEESYFLNKANILAMLDELFGADEHDDAKSASAHNASSAVRGCASRSLPKITLPKFSGKYIEWPSFRDLFHSMVGGVEDLPPVEKLHYLKEHLVDEAARLLSGIAVTSENFDRAWEMLTARYENKRLLATSYLDQLFTLAPLTKRSASSLKQLLATVRDTIGALRALDVPVESWDVILVYFVARRLDRTSLEEWELQRGASTELASFAELELFIEGRIRALEMVGARTDGSAEAATATKGKAGSRPVAKANAAVVKSVSCAHCGANHYVASCADFCSRTPEQRRDIVVAKRLCFNCLGAHKFSECRTARRCRVCSSQHHTLIHRDGASSSAPAPPLDADPGRTASATGSPSAVALASFPGAGELPSVLLATARVRVEIGEGDAIEVRALLDQGSELSFVSESLVQGLRLSRRRAAISVLGMGASCVGSTRGVVSLRLRSCVDPSFALDVSAYILPKLTTAVPARNLATASWPHLAGLALADPYFARSGGIDLVLGVGAYAGVLQRDVRRGADDAPVAQRTSLGWVVSGPVGESQGVGSSSAGRSLIGQVGDELGQLVERFWAQEEVDSPGGGLLSPDEQECEAHFQRNTCRDPSGRYVVRLPFRSSVEPHLGLGDSRSSAHRMLRRMQQRFARDLEFGRLYGEFLREYEALGHISVAPTVDRAVFLPHHGVLRDSSTTTKLRVVFNGSWRAASGDSLNDRLHVGPRLQTDIADVLTRWRRYRFVFLADIEKMYRQILVHPDDRDNQRILWSASRPPLEYRLNTVTYGLSCAPYLALRVLQRLAEDEGRLYPAAVDVVRREMYVDDVLSGADSVDLARIKATQLDQLLMAGGFRLGKWISNAEGVLASVDPARCGTSSARDVADENIARALGLSWLPSADSFTFRFQRGRDQGPYTKRTILSRTAQLFDPLGWIAPVVVSAKILLQTLWSLELGWDDEVPQTIGDRWTSFERELPRVADYQIPRWIGFSGSNQAIELHGFSDASRAALGAVLYLRVMDEAWGDARVTLLLAKSRVAPLKKQTIPRLELSAALLLARLVSRAIITLGLADAPAYLWTDSSVALAWIRGDPSRWKDYVANRVSSIRELVPGARWRHVAGIGNPADCASRGLTPSELGDFKLWWRGPEWLRGPSVAWPSASPLIADGTELEERVVAAAFAASTDATRAGAWDIIERFSRLRRLLRVTGWILRAVSRFRRIAINSPPGSLLPAELATAESYWVRATQAEFYGSVIAALAGGSALPRSHPLLRLSPFVDGDGILRMGGRLRNARLDPAARYPALLPRDAAFSKLLIGETHLRLLHGGVQITLATLRQKYWLVGGRAAVGAAIRRCVRCARFRADLACQMMGQLPRARVCPSRPFLNSGVDYAGPFEAKTWRGRSARTYKEFLIVFVCFATSAVHREMATDYSTQGFLAAYKRFTGRRGVCSSLTSDCGTNLVGADAELRRLFSATTRELGELRQILASDGTSWRFNPPAAPHFGGKWEAAVKSVKFHLRRIIGDARLTYEEYCTLLAQVEAVLNSRPISALSDDPEDVEALTPGHFLVGGPLTLPPEPSLSSVSTSRLSRWQHLRQMLERFWARWSSEYLQRLQSISKWRQPSRRICVGSMVLLADELTTRQRSGPWVESLPRTQELTAWLES